MQVNTNDSQAKANISTARLRLTIMSDPKTSAETMKIIHDGVKEIISKLNE